MTIYDQITTPEGLARFLVALEYEDTAILATLRKAHPDADADQLLAEAKAQKVESDRQVEQELDREAIEQEHRP